MHMNSALGKRVLALARGGDYAHAGEEEAIRLALDPIPRDHTQRLLDAGCGRGGTAHFVQAQGWGQVSGFDIEGESVAQAKARHPELNLAVCDVVKVADHFPAVFDVIYAFNAFYAFPDQPGALRALRSVARPGTRLMLFDYVDRGGYAESAFAQCEESAHWRPLVLETFPAELAAAGWEVESIRDLNGEYERWYADLLHRFEAKRSEIVAIADEALYQHAYDFYALLLESVRQGIVGGAIVYARAR